MRDTTLPGSTAGDRADPKTPPVLALVILWCRDEAARVGEVALLLPYGTTHILGRGDAQTDDGGRRVQFVKQLPGEHTKEPPLAGQRISRRQLALVAQQGELRVEVVGRCATRVNGVPVTGTTSVSPGDTLLLDGELLLGCVRRRPNLRVSPWRAQHERAPRARAFGEPDAHGIVGESEAAWQLRHRIAFVGPSPAHVLITGPSGGGKELVARAIARSSARSEGPWIARNAATLPAGLIDAELFGHAANYPNAGVPERRGLIGEAHGGTLFLDEIGELPSELQGHLLRVLDSGGEYQRLGDPSVRHADFRLVAATNRHPEHLKHDVLARLKLHVEVPGLDDRKEDIPLLLDHLARRAARADARIAQQFADEDGAVRFDPLLVDGLVRHHYTLHARELDSLLWSAFGGSHRRVVELTEDLSARLTTERGRADPHELTREDVEAALVTCEGNQQRAFRLLNLKNRDLLYRLIKRHGIDPKRFQP